MTLLPCPVLEHGLSVPRQHWSDAAAHLFPCLHRGQLKGPEGSRSRGASLPVSPTADVTPAQDTRSPCPNPLGSMQTTLRSQLTPPGPAGASGPPRTPLITHCGASPASVCPHFCPSWRGRVCLLMAPSAEQTEHGDRRAAGRELPLLPPARALQ